MEILKTIREIDAYPGIESQEPKEWKQRQAARAVTFDGDGKVALLHVSKLGFYKLPGGGVDEGETIEQALKRECLEEIGCNVEKYAELGRVVEYRNKFVIKQESFCYLAKVVGKKGNPNFMQDEIEDGFKVVWTELDKAINLVAGGKPTSYDGPFIIIRDLAFLNKAKEILSQAK